MHRHGVARFSRRLHVFGFPFPRSARIGFFVGSFDNYFGGLCCRFRSTWGILVKAAKTGRTLRPLANAILLCNPAIDGPVRACHVTPTVASHLCIELS